MVMITPYCMTNFLITSLSVFFSSQLSFLFRCCCNQNITPLIPSWLCFWFNFTAEHHTHNVLLNRNTVISLWENLKRYICVYDFTTYVLKSGPLILYIVDVFPFYSYIINFIINCRPNLPCEAKDGPKVQLQLRLHLGASN
jgi:hypothetical protein